MFGNKIIDGYDHYPFGLEMPERSYTTTGVKEMFTGKERDREETGLDYFGARYYTPELGRWLSVDPLGGDYPGHSPYNYVMNNPLNLIDPTGMCPEGTADDKDGPGCVDGGVYSEPGFGVVTVTA